MILRYWRGWTTPKNAGAYEEIVSGKVLPSIADRGIAGSHGAYLLRRPRGLPRAHAFARFVYAATLGRQFGPQYEAYRRAAPSWRALRRPWTPPDFDQARSTGGADARSARVARPFRRSSKSRPIGKESQ